MREHDGVRHRRPARSPSVYRHLHRLGAACAAHPWRTISAWVVVLALSLGLASVAGGSFHDDYDIPGAPSQAATELMRRELPAGSGTDARVVVHDSSGRPVPVAALATLRGRLMQVPGAAVDAGVARPARAAAQPRRRPGPVGGHRRGAAGPGAGRRQLTPSSPSFSRPPPCQAPLEGATRSITHHPAPARVSLARGRRRGRHHGDGPRRWWRSDRSRRRAREGRQRLSAGLSIGSSP